MPTSLAQRLRAETGELHAAAERSALMGALMRGEMPAPAYAALLRNLHALYATLEPALVRHAAHPLLAPIASPALWRTPALEADLRALAGAGWADAIALQPAAQRYAHRLHELDASRPALLLAHAYVRFLGDLSGGQMLRRAVGRVFGPAFGSTTAFYEFGDAGQTAALTQAFRAGLAGLAPAPDEADAIVAEAKNAFVAHRVLFDELAAAVPLQVDGAAPLLHR